MIFFKIIIKKFFGKNIFFYLRQIYYFASNNYILSKPIGTKKMYLDLYKKEIRKNYKKIDNYLKKNRRIDVNFINNLALLTQISLNKNEINFQHGKIIYSELGKYLINNKKIKKFIICEIGTGKGFSSIVMSKAIYDYKAKASIYSLDIIPHNLKIYWNSISDHLLGKISRSNLLNEYKKFLVNINYINKQSENFFKNLPLKRLHFAFIDGDHDYNAAKKDYLSIKSRQQSGDVIIFDDYTPGLFPGVVKLVKEITKSKIYKTKIIFSSKQRGYALCYKI
jgi:predicted O-methyltransferase YrrM